MANIKQAAPEKNKGMNKHAINNNNNNNRAQIVEVHSSDLKMPDENNNKYRYLR